MTQICTFCSQIPVQYGNIVVHDTQDVCEKGVMVTLDDVTYCLHITEGESCTTC